MGMLAQAIEQGGARVQQLERLELGGVTVSVDVARRLLLAVLAHCPAMWLLELGHSNIVPDDRHALRQLAAMQIEEAF